jgi:hypothetical protein
MFCIKKKLVYLLTNDILCRGGISNNIRSLGISNFSSDAMLDPQKVVPFAISAEDQTLVDILAVPENQQTLLITLERAVLAKNSTEGIQLFFQNNDL